MPALTLDEQLVFDVAVALKRVKSRRFDPIFSKMTNLEGRGGVHPADSNQGSRGTPNAR